MTKKSTTNEKNTEEKKNDTPVQRAWVSDNAGIYLTVMDTYNKKYFAYLEGNEIKFAPALPRNPRIIPRSLPWKDGAPIKIVGVPLREAIEVAQDMDITEIEKLINDHLHKYCDLRISDKILCVFYIFFSWFYPKINTLPYLRFRADSGKGKTRIQKGAGDLCFYPITAEGAGSASGIMRFKEKWHGTLVMDEMDLRSSNTESGGYQQDMIKYLNLGFERGKFFLKTDKSDLKKQDIFDPFCPKIISMRGIFQDVATEGRILSISPDETRRDDIPPVLHQDYYDNVILLRGIITRYVLKNWSKIDGNKYPDLTALKVEPRLKQLTEPIGTIISQLFPDGMEKIKTYIRSRQIEIRKDRSESWEGMCFNLAYSKAIEEDNPGYVTPQSIAKILGTKAGSVTKTLKNIGFDIDIKQADVPVIVKSMGTEKEETRRKSIRYLNIPSEQKWNEIYSRYYYEEPIEEGGQSTFIICDNECPVALKARKFITLPKPETPKVEPLDPEKNTVITLITPKKDRPNYITSEEENVSDVNTPPTLHLLHLYDIGQEVVLSGVENTTPDEEKRDLSFSSVIDVPSVILQKNTADTKISEIEPGAEK